LHEGSAAFPLEPLPRFLRGRLLYLGDRCADAEPDLAAAAEADVARPQWMDGWIALYRGLAERSLGNESAALEQFRRAAALRRFRAADRATLELQAGRPPSARCAR
jgi:hypothetical protein